MRDNERRDFAPFDGVHNRAKLLALEIQSAADFVDPLDVGQTTRSAERFERAFLIE